MQIKAPGIPEGVNLATAAAGGRRLVWAWILLGGLSTQLALAQEIVPDPAPSAGQAARMTPALRQTLSRVGCPVVSPDGTLAVYAVSSADEDSLARRTHLWLMELPGAGGRQITRGQSAGAPAWSADGRAIYFLRGGQIWSLPLAGGEAEQLTAIPGGIRAFQPNPNPAAPPALRLAISRAVHPDCPAVDWECTARARARWQGRPGLVSELFPLRHWSDWRDSLVTRIYIGDPAGGVWRDLIGESGPRPPLALANRNTMAFSADGSGLAVIRNADRDEALSTDNDIFLIDLRAAVDHGPGSVWEAAHLLSTGLSGGGGNDDEPVFSPDGRWIAFTSMKRAGYESDLRQIVVQDMWTGAERCLSCGLDRSARGLAWSHDSRSLFFTAYDREASALYRIDVASGESTRLLRAGSLWGPRPLSDGRLLLMMGSSRMPDEIFLYDPAAPGSWEDDLALAADGRFGRPTDSGDFPPGPLRQMSFHNWDRLEAVAMHAPQHFRFEGALGDSVHGFILRPPGISDTLRVPLVLVLHGGPQWAYHDFWLRSYNFQMIAARGYAVATVNFHGSAGFGIAFQDAIRGHWGDIPAEDVRRGLNHIFAEYDFVDSTRVAAIGRSYGGYLVNWLNAHSRRFSCLVAHSGSFNKAAAWGTTEELWFPEWEFMGLPWEQPEVYAANSPALFAGQMQTPTLVIHGQRDYRVDLSEGLQTYTALRRRGVQARFLTFPDEGHHIHDWQAWELMWKEIFAWLERFIG